MSEAGNPNINELKESITLLCRMCKYAGIFDQVTPEHIRQAKFDKPEVINILLDFLHGLLRFQHENNHRGSEAQTSKSQFILQRLRSCRYPRISRLYNEGERICSSREILLALAWYMHYDRTVDLIRTIALKPVDLLALISNLAKQEAPAEHFSSQSTLSMAEKSNYLAWIVSQIHLTTKQIMSLERGNSKKEQKLVEKANSDLQCEPLLLLLFRYPHLLKQYENLIEKRTLLLQSYIKWKNVESAFWLWMRSVLASANKEQNSPPLNSHNPSLSDPTKLHTGSIFYKAVRKKLSQLQKEFSEQQKEFLEHSSQSVELFASVQPEQKADIDRELRTMKIHLQDPQHRPRLKFADGEASTRIEKHGHIVETSIPLDWEQERIKRINDELEGEIHRLRSQASQQLMELSKTFRGVVLIPPVIPNSHGQTSSVL